MYIVTHTWKYTCACAYLDTVKHVSWSLDRLGLSPSRYVLMVLLTVRPRELIHEGLTSPRTFSSSRETPIIAASFGPV